jgi:hypothetical protein
LAAAFTLAVRESGLFWWRIFMGELMRTFGAKDVADIAERAVAGGKSGDPGTVLRGLFAELGEQATVSGADLSAGLSQGLAKGGISVPAEANGILSKVDKLTKDGDTVTLALKEQLRPTVRGAGLKLGPEIKFAVQNFPDGVALADISGIEVNKFIWIVVQRVQFHESGGKRRVRVDTNMGGKDFDLPS